MKDLILQLESGEEISFTQESDLSSTERGHILLGENTKLRAELRCSESALYVWTMNPETIEENKVKYEVSSVKVDSGKSPLPLFSPPEIVYYF